MRILGGLFRRRVLFVLRPDQDLAQVDSSGKRWTASGSNPGFTLLTNSGRYPIGWVFVESSLLRQGESRIAKLCYETGAGTKRMGSIFVPVSPVTGKIMEVVKLPRGIVRLQWRPMESTGRITQGAFAVTEITWLEASIRRAVRVLLMKKKASDSGGRLAFRDVLRVLVNLESEHAAAGQARNIGAPRQPEAKRTVIEHLRPNAGRLLDSEAEQSGASNYRFHVDAITPRAVIGWVVNKRSPHIPVEVDFYVNGEFVERKISDLERLDVATAGQGGPRCGFSFSLPGTLLRGPGVKVTLCPRGSTTPLGGCSYILANRDLLIRGLLTAVETLTRTDNSADHPSTSSAPASDHHLTAIRRYLFPKLLRQLRVGWQNLPDIFEVPEYSASASDRVDVIIPVYRGVDETVACVQSVIAARVRTQFDLIVLNDCSPQPELTAALRSLSTLHGFLLLEHAENTGFVRTANQGMMVHADRDVVLLNSDTVVSDGWLDSMRTAAHVAHNVGTVTPISNRATICSFPRGDVDNDLPTGVSIPEMAAACARANHGLVADIPTAIGFCMYIRRDALREVGYFDEVLWDKGYGEENDFCMRASSLGWRHVAACDTFVFHHGSVSFSGEQSERQRQNLETLSRIYPDYNDMIARFIRSDPLAPARRRLFVELCRLGSQRYMLFLLHSWGGGADVAATDLATRLAASGEAVLFLAAQNPDTLTLRVFGSNLMLEYRGAHPYEDVLEDLRQLNVWHAHVHQLPGFSPDIYDLIPKLGVPYDISIHDYYYICPRIHLIDGSDIYCGEPDEKGCNTCLKSDGAHEACRDTYRRFGADIGAWRARNADLLKQARLVIAPSKDAETRIGKYFPLRNISVKPHPEPVRTITARDRISSDTLTVAIIGAIGIHKGFNVLKACAEDAKRRSLPLRFVVVGYTCDDAQFRDLDNVVITGQYERDRLSSILREHDCAVAGFFNLTPETFSYTLSEAWANGLFPLVFDLGAQAERVRATGFGLVVPLSSTPNTINDLLMNSANRVRSAGSTCVVGANYSDLLTDYYQLANRLQPDTGPSDSRAFRHSNLQDSLG
jgi:GT2 family glycosyltransferase